MILKRLYCEPLAQASYLVGCPAVGGAIVIDPTRDLDLYLRVAAAEGLVIKAVTETHIHADFLSGARELARRTGATLYLSDEGDASWKYAYAEEAGAVLVRHGDSIKLGSVRLDVLRTPGHTPEHVSFLLTDEAATAEPLGLFSGDFLFVGDVGRPDLLESAAGLEGTMEPAARELFRSLQALRVLPSHLLVWPGHGAGSPCGKALGAMPVTSLGYERLSNWAMKATEESGFVREVLSGQPEPPPYFARMKRLNQQGPPFLPESLDLAELDGASLGEALASGRQVLDVRPSSVSLGGFVPGSLVVPLGPGFLKWSGSLLSESSDIVLLASSGEQARAAASELRLLGLDRVAGFIGPEALEAYVRSGGSTEPLSQISAAELLENDGRYTVVDVRGADEWNEGHLPGALHLPLGQLARRHGEIPREKPVVLLCSSGWRSRVAVSVLRREGFPRAANVAEGYLGIARLRQQALRV